MSETNEQKMTAEEINAFLDEHFPQARGRSRRFSVETVSGRSIRMRMEYNDNMLRPGGTISGPAMFALADVAMYAAVLALIGPKALAVTSNLNINFLRKPKPADMIADATVLKLGKRMAVGEIALRSADEEELVAHATSTYAIPRDENDEVK